MERWVRQYKGHWYEVEATHKRSLCVFCIGSLYTRISSGTLVMLLSSLASKSGL